MQKDTLQLKTVEALKNAPVSQDAVVFLISAVTMGDNKGGFYTWDSTSTETPETTYYNVVQSNTTTTGRWVRVFQRARNLPHGVLVNNGGVMHFYCPTTVGSNSEATINLTMDGTATGTAIFSEVWSTNGEAVVNTSTANDVVMGNRKSLSADKKQLTYYFSRGNTQTLGATLLLIAGLVITGLRTAQAGTSVIIKVEGI